MPRHQSAPRQLSRSVPQIDLRSLTERQEDAGADLLSGAEVTQTSATGKFQEASPRSWQPGTRCQLSIGMCNQGLFRPSRIVTGGSLAGQTSFLFHVWQTLQQGRSLAQADWPSNGKSTAPR